jgi:hypothetical protein
VGFEIDHSLRADEILGAFELIGSLRGHKWRLGGGSTREGRTIPGVVHQMTTLTDHPLDEVGVLRGPDAGHAEGGFDPFVREDVED